MKKIGKLNIPEKFITAAYTGACAAHQVDVHEDLFGENNVNFHEHFTKNFEQIKGSCTDIVEELPPTLSLKEMVSNSPANHPYGGL